MIFIRYFPSYRVFCVFCAIKVCEGDSKRNEEKIGLWSTLKAFLWLTGTNTHDQDIHMGVCVCANFLKFQSHFHMPEGNWGNHTSVYQLVYAFQKRFQQFQES